MPINNEFMIYTSVFNLCVIDTICKSETLIKKTFLNNNPSDILALCDSLMKSSYLDIDKILFTKFGDIYSLEKLPSKWHNNNDERSKNPLFDDVKKHLGLTIGSPYTNAVQDLIPQSLAAVLCSKGFLKIPSVDTKLPFIQDFLAHRYYNKKLDLYQLYDIVDDAKNNKLNDIKQKIISKRFSVQKDLITLYKQEKCSISRKLIIPPSMIGSISSYSLSCCCCCLVLIYIMMSSGT